MPGIDINEIPDDPELENQKYVCITYVPHLESNTLFFKIRGSYPTPVEAQQRAMELQEIDPIFPIYVGEVGKFLPAQSNLINLGESSFVFSIDGVETEDSNPHSIPFNLIEDANTESAMIIAYKSTSLAISSFWSFFQMWFLLLSSYFLGEEGSQDLEKKNTTSVQEETTPDTFKDELSCLACMNAAREIVCLPCRHFSLCLECSKEHIKRSKKCPMCRKDISEIINVFT